MTDSALEQPFEKIEFNIEIRFKPWKGARIALNIQLPDPDKTRFTVHEISSDRLQLKGMWTSGPLGGNDGLVTLTPEQSAALLAWYERNQGQVFYSDELPMLIIPE